MRISGDGAGVVAPDPAEVRAQRRRDAQVRSIVAQASIALRAQGDVSVRDARFAVEVLSHMPVRAERMLDRTGGGALIVGPDVELTETWPLEEFGSGQIPRRGAAWKGVGVMDAKQNRTGEGHGSSQALLHEVGHVLDATMRLRRPPTDPREPWLDRGDWESARPPFRNDDTRVDGEFNRFYDPIEWFAEAFARYGASPRTHRELERDAPATFEYMQATFGEPRFRN